MTAPRTVRCGWPRQLLEAVRKLPHTNPTRKRGLFVQRPSLARRVSVGMRRAHWRDASATRCCARRRPRRGPAGFTLIELLITISIIAIMASMILFAFYSAQQISKEQKTKALIAKLDAIIKAKYDSFRTRRVPIVFQADTFDDTSGDGIWQSGENLFFDWKNIGTWDPAPTPAEAAKMRLDVLRDMMRMELPDRWTDVADPPITPFEYPAGNKIARTGAAQAIYRKWQVISPSPPFASAECLYMIVMNALQEEGDSNDVFRPDDVGDVDGDGAKEFLDGWGRPIKFVRWPAGFQFSELQIAATGSASGSTSITVTGANLSSSAGSYIGGALAQYLPASADQPAMLDTTMMARIAGYQYAAPNATITPPSMPAPPNFNNQSVIMQPDPFDPSGVYGAMPTSVPPFAPPFATYPLIFSGGPDKCYGIMVDKDSAAPLRYADAATTKLNPFVVITEAVTPAPVTSLMGTARNDDKEENYVKSAWLDNIHNHMITSK